jgi:branched-chain amino acid transport system ATP-binding protein
VIAFTVAPLAGNLVIVVVFSTVVPATQGLGWMLGDARERRDYYDRWPLSIPGPLWGLGFLINLVLGYFFGIFLGKRVAAWHPFGPLKVLIVILTLVLVYAVAAVTLLVYITVSRRTQGVIPFVDERLVAEGVTAAEAVVADEGGGAGSAEAPAGRAVATARAAVPAGRAEALADRVAPAVAPGTAGQTSTDAGAPSGEPLLEAGHLEVFYGAARALRGISFEVYPGQVVSIIGGNGAGKSTTLKTISGVPELLKSVLGGITFEGERIERLPPHKIARRGIVHVPEGRHVFPETSVEDNLILGAYRRYSSAKARLGTDLEAVYARFPVLKDRRSRPAGLLSGGEQQMLAIGRGLMAQPRLLLLDEPSLGLAPILIEQMFEIIKRLAAEGTTILLVEQMANQALEIADRAYVLETGTITLSGSGPELLDNPAVKEAYLGA